MEKRTRRAPSHLSQLTLAAGLLTLTGAVAACQTEPERNLGSTLENRGQQVQEPPATAEPSEPLSVPMKEFVGRWVGTAEDPLALGGPGQIYTFPSGSSEIVLDIQLPPPDDFASALKASITFGSGPAPEPPTDGSVGYPLGVSYESLSYFREGPLSAASYSGVLPPVEGFAYTLTDVLDLSLLTALADEEDPSTADGVLVYELSTHEVLQPWCELQTPKADNLAPFGCLGRGSIQYDATTGRCARTLDDSSEVFSAVPPEELESYTDEQWQALQSSVQILEHEEMDCNRLILCASYRCTCDEASCGANLTGYISRGSADSPPISRTASRATLTLRRTGEELVGVLAGAVFPNARHLNVPPGVLHFTRATSE